MVSTTMANLPPDPIYVLRGETGPMHSLLFKISPHVEHLYAGAESGNVHIWDLKTNREILKLSKFKNSCLAIHAVGDEYLITQRKFGALNIWNVDNSSWIESKTIDTDYYGFCRCAPTMDNILFVPLSNARVGMFSMKTLKIESELNIRDQSKLKTLGEVMAIKPCWDESRHLLVTYEGGHVALWDTKEKAVLSWMDTENCTMTIDFDNLLNRGVIGNPTDTIQVFELQKPNNFSQKTRLTIKNPGISILRIRPDSRVFAAGCWDAKIRIFSWKTLKPLVVLDEHRSTIHDIIYSTCRVESYNSKCLMAATSKDGNISLWDLYN